MKGAIFGFKEIMKLGFTREEYTDAVFRDIHGYNPFWVTKEINVHHLFGYEMDLSSAMFKIQLRLDWDCVDHTVELVRYDNENGDVLGRMSVRDMNEMKQLIKFYEKQPGI